MRKGLAVFVVAVAQGIKTLSKTKRAKNKSRGIRLVDRGGRFFIFPDSEAIRQKPMVVEKSQPPPIVINADEKGLYEGLYKLVCSSYGQVVKDQLTYDEARELVVDLWRKHQNMGRLNPFTLTVVPRDFTWRPTGEGSTSRDWVWHIWERCSWLPPKYEGYPQAPVLDFGPWGKKV